MALGFQLGFTFYVYYFSNKPTALSWCVTVTLQVPWRSNNTRFQIRRSTGGSGASPLITAIKIGLHLQHWNGVGTCYITLNREYPTFTSKIWISKNFLVTLHHSEGPSQVKY